MSLPDFSYRHPASFEDAFAMRARDGADARYFSGGTALMLLMRAGLLHPVSLIGVRDLPGMRDIEHVNGVVRIGASTTHAEVAASPLVRDLLPTVAETFDHVATRRVRNVGTIGGNLAHANPHQDPPVTLTAFDATVVARGPGGERRISLGDLFVDYFQTSLAPEEILTAIEIPVPPRDSGSSFIKFLPRSADDYATVNVAVRLQRDGDRVTAARVAVGSLGATVLRSGDAEALLTGGLLDDARLERASEAAVAAADPELDSRGTPEYKRRVAPVIVGRAIRAAWQNCRDSAR
jgi:aerobic carbon-monoxide dehydrogenase medium subunit